MTTLWAIKIKTRAGAAPDELVSGDDDAVVALGAFVAELQRRREAEGGLGQLAFKPPLLLSIEKAK